jgi:uncharacterized protein YdgA (DUF945 family)
MQKLKTIAAVGGAVVLIGIWPLAVGQIGQNVLTDAIENATNQGVNIELVEYDRGYLSSTAKSKLTVVDPLAVAQLEASGWPTEYEFEHDISHGLVSLSGKTHHVGTPQYVLETDTQLNGNTEFRLATSAQQFDLDSSDPMTVIMGPISFEGTLTVLGKMEYQLDMPSLAFDLKDGAVISFNGIKSSGEGNIEEGLWLGEQTVALTSFSVSDSERNNVIDMQEMNYQFKTSEDETQQILQGDYLLNIDSVKNQDGEANNINLSFTAGGFDKMAFLSLTNLYQKSPVWTEQDTQTASPHIDTLIAKGFFLKLNQFSLEIEQGRFESDFEFRIPQNASNNSQDIMKLIGMIEGNMNVFISNHLVQAYPYIKENLDELLIMDIANQTEDGYELKMKLKQGQVEFPSGQKAPLMALLIPVFMSQTH